MIPMSRFRGHENSIFSPAECRVCVLWSRAGVTGCGCSAWCAPWSVGAGAMPLLWVVSRLGGEVPVDAAGICYSEQAVQTLLAVWGLCWQDSARVMQICF